ncbi:hypothetical protein A3A36_02460 [Candidatus Kaiserbacteria bacterium RIFCSPLOWO2_01_FULL_52_12b]|uniref:Uncharacterized protein n=1 Tax=Candidatus Kaiserbacteria bacterium RIFCSPLOWO2_01_FULL_52_12b TaxID=1798509 RepID=A0A1F6EWB1_9BACT|nr:MAG: hypothetical protein A3A36_02460 [Candidatus Kaiserbacteria bacterium RIFCSPLOWO2_01_FULL_52_12b]
MPRNLVFLLWMLGFPLIGVLTELNLHFFGSMLTAEDRGMIVVFIFTLVFFVIIWFYVGSILYEEEPSKPE